MVFGCTLCRALQVFVETQLEFVSETAAGMTSEPQAVFWQGGNAREGCQSSGQGSSVRRCLLSPTMWISRRVVARYPVRKKFSFDR